MPPSILLSLVIASVYGCAFHAVFGRRMWQWPLFWVMAVVGFFGGFVIGVALGIDLLLIGSVPLLPATFGAGVLLALAWYFSTPAAESR